MIRALLYGIIAAFITVCTPVMLLDPLESAKQENYLMIVRQFEEESETDVGIMVDLRTENEVIQIPLETYLVGVVLSEMPASFELEALKAQAVAARTFTLRQMENSKHDDCDLCNDSTCCQAWTSEFDMEEKLGDSFRTIWEKGCLAVETTKGEAIYYNDKLIDAVYFSCSGGKTEDANVVWGSDIPYLRSVSSPGEENARVYSSEVLVARERFADIMYKQNKNICLSGDPETWFGAMKRTSGNGVQTLVIGGVEFSGKKIREIFGLRSTNFTVYVAESGIVFSVLGNGHRVGMSQYGANAMAAEGKTYTQILSFYYTGIDIKKHP